MATRPSNETLPLRGVAPILGVNESGPTPTPSGLVPTPHSGYPQERGIHSQEISAKSAKNVSYQQNDPHLEGVQTRFRGRENGPGASSPQAWRERKWTFRDR